MARKKRTREDMKKACGHVKYEVDMLRAVADEMDVPRSRTQAQINVLVESYAIHLRNLIEFLWPKSPQKDDVIADDFLESGAHWSSGSGRSAALKQAYARVSKEVAHLTYSRLRVTPETKPWRAALAREVLDAFEDFVSRVPAGYADLLGASNQRGDVGSIPGLTSE